MTASQNKTCDLSQKRCLPCEGLGAALSSQEALNFLKTVPQWTLIEENSLHKIQRLFKFKKGYIEQLLFINAVAWMAHQENHHPDIFFTFDHCRVIYYTHAVKGLSENDFICAAKLDRLYKPDAEA